MLNTCAEGFEHKATEILATIGVRVPITKVTGRTTYERRVRRQCRVIVKSGVSFAMGVLIPRFHTVPQQQDNLTIRTNCR